MTRVPVEHISLKKSRAVYGDNIRDVLDNGRVVILTRLGRPELVMIPLHPLGSALRRAVSLVEEYPGRTQAHLLLWLTYTLLPVSTDVYEQGFDACVDVEEHAPLVEESDTTALADARIVPQVVASLQRLADTVPLAEEHASELRALVRVLEALAR